MKLLSVVIPCYNSEPYLDRCVEKLLIGADDMEILIVDDGSTDATPAMADAYEAKYPGLIRALHKENGGHGDAIMFGLKAAEGLYFKVVDSDDWLDSGGLRRVLDVLRAHTDKEKWIDLMVCNYIYDKEGKKHKHVVRYGNVFAENQLQGWETTKNFRQGQYLLMHAAIYRRELLNECGLYLPPKTFYVDNIYVYVPLPYADKVYYLNEDLYHYVIGRSDQSVNEKIMISRIDQQLRVNYMMMDAVDLEKVDPVQKRKYMYKYLEIITTVSSILLIKSGTEENLRKKEKLWADMKEQHPEIYRTLRKRLFGTALNLRGPLGRKLAIGVYNIAQKVVGFN